VPSVIREFLDRFKPDLIHSHHPFLLGDAALREAWKRHVPIVFTHHTLYERYTHYVPMDSQALKRVAVQLATEYGNLCDQVIAPSASIESLLRERGVRSPIEAIPTGIDTAFFARGNGDRFRKQAGLAPDVRIIGHVGRLAREKNLLFLAEAVARCLRDDPAALFLVVGDGEARTEMLDEIRRLTGSPSRVHAPGKLAGQALADAYAAMDWFVFASQTETQGLVLAEAMAAATPVVALDGPGVREIVTDDVNGCLLPAHADVPAFATALARLMGDRELSHRCALGARESAQAFDTSRCVTRLLDCYENLVQRYQEGGSRPDLAPWDRLLGGVEIEWNLFVEKMSAAAAAVGESPAPHQPDLD